MGQDISAEIAGAISGSKVFGSSENIRHGKYVFLIKRIFAEKVTTDKGDQRMAFWELMPVKSEPNPQVEGDHVDYPGISGPLKDDGTKPNAVGSSCALKVNFDGPGARSAGSNLKFPILALFNKRDGEVPDAEVNKTWLDLARQVPLKVNDIERYDPTTNQPVLAMAPKQANPACGMLIGCSTSPKRKKTANASGAFITRLNWFCVAPIGTGENSSELIAKRRAEIEANMFSEDEDEVAHAPSPTPPPAPHIALPPPPPPQQIAAPPPPPPPAPPPPVTVPGAPWEKHPTAAWGATPETQWFFSNPARGGDNKVKSLAAIRAGL